MKLPGTAYKINMLHVFTEIREGVKKNTSNMSQQTRRRLKKTTRNLKYNI